MNKWTSPPRNLFLLDGGGALLSAFLLLALLAQNEAWFGMPPEVARVLGGFALAFSAYSFGCYFFAGSKWPLLLLLIAVLNLFYCCMTAVLIAYFFDRLTLLGWAYFLGELFILYRLIRLEFQTVPKNPAE